MLRTWKLDEAASLRDEIANPLANARADDLSPNDRSFRARVRIFAQVAADARIIVALLR